MEGGEGRSRTPGEDFLMAVRLGGVEDHEEKVGALADGDDLPAPALSLSCPFDNTGQIQKLDLRVVVVNHPRNAS